MRPCQTGRNGRGHRSGTGQISPVCWRNADRPGVLKHLVGADIDREFNNPLQNALLNTDVARVADRMLTQDKLRMAVVGPHRALFGTDAPYGFHGADHSYDYAHIKNWIERLPVRSADIDRILGDTAARLLTDAR